MAEILNQSGFQIIVMENNFVAKDGRPLLLMSTNDYKKYKEKLTDTQTKKAP